MANTKHYLIVSLTLGSIAAVSALLIAGTHLLTKDIITQNDEDKIDSGIQFIFGENAKRKDESEIKDKYQYVDYVYEIESDKDLGYVFRTTGKNMYGKITLIVGFDLVNQFVSMKTIVNEQTYTKEVEKFVADVDDSKRDIEDVSCGATYGAKLVRDMVNEAELASKEKVWLK